MAAIRFYAVVNYGYGHHARKLPAEMVVKFQQSFIAVQESYFLNATLTKSSLLYMYYRIFGVSSRFVKALWVTFALVMAYFIVCSIVAIAGCRPVTYFWDKAGGGTCIDETQFFRWNGIMNMDLDILILVLPLPMVWNLNLAVGQKLQLTGVFALGILYSTPLLSLLGKALLTLMASVCIVSVLRISAFRKSRQSDPTYTTIDTATWSSVEQSVAIICACLPTLMPLFRPRGAGARASGPATDVRLSTVTAQQIDRSSKYLHGISTNDEATESVVGFLKATDSCTRTARSKDDQDSV